MGEFLNSFQLSQASCKVAEMMGLNFPEARWRELERGVVSAAAAEGYTTAAGETSAVGDTGVSAYCHDLLSGSLTRDQIEELSTHLTIGETYFFREKPAFNALRDSILPELIRTRRGGVKQLRVWSAGCCTGEEAYSTTILLNQLIPDLSEWMLTILATDINPRFLKKAMAGIYGEWSFRDIPAHVKQRYFTETTAGRFEINPLIKRQVTFSALNLVEDSYPSIPSKTKGMDVILCRNVLMYFSAQQAKKVVHKFYESLVDGGWLVVGLGEASHILFSDFKMVQFANAILYQKKSDQKSDRIDISSAFEEIPIVAKPVHPPQLEAKRPITKSHVMSKQGSHLKAEQRIQVEVPEKPEETPSLLLSARLCADQGRLDEALVWCEGAIAANRLNLRAHYLCATIQEERGEISEAIKALKRALYLDPDFVVAHFALGSLARRQGKKQEADKHFANMFLLLQGYQPDEILPESDGLTAGSMAEMAGAERSR